MFRSRLLPWPFLLAACAAEVPTSPLEPAQITIATAPSSGTPGWLLDAPLSVKVTDVTGRPVSGATVTWHAEAEGARVETATPAASEHFEWDLDPRFVVEASSVTDANGVAQVQYLAGWPSGTQRVTARAGSGSTSINVLVSSFTATVFVSGSSRACGLDTQGRMYCWKPAWRSRREPPTTLPVSMRPVPAAGAERYLLLTGNNIERDVDVCGLTTDRQLRCANFGSADVNGVITMQPVVTPVPFVMIAGSGVGAIPGQSWLCGLDATGQAWCRGRNDQGQLGDGTTISRTTFSPVTGDVRFSSLVASESRICGTDLTGGAWCWGDGPAIQLGIPFGNFTTIPTAVAVGRSYREVAPISAGVCGIRVLTNQMECWGSAVIQLSGLVGLGGGFGQDPLVPHPVVGGPVLREMSGSSNSSGQFLTVDGRIGNWGDQVPFDLQLQDIPEFGAGLTGFDRILTRGNGAICSSHSSGSTICSWVYYRGVGVPVP